MQGTKVEDKTEIKKRNEKMKKKVVEMEDR